MEDKFSWLEEEVKTETKVVKKRPSKIRKNKETRRKMWELKQRVPNWYRDEEVDSWLTKLKEQQDIGNHLSVYEKESPEKEMFLEREKMSLEELREAKDSLVRKLEKLRRDISNVKNEKMELIGKSSSGCLKIMSEMLKKKKIEKEGNQRKSFDKINEQNGANSGKKFLFRNNVWNVLTDKEYKIMVLLDEKLTYDETESSDEKMELGKKHLRFLNDFQKDFLRLNNDDEIWEWTRQSWSMTETQVDFSKILLYNENEESEDVLKGPFGSSFYLLRIDSWKELQDRIEDLIWRELKLENMVQDLETDIKNRKDCEEAMTREEAKVFTESKECESKTTSLENSDVGKFELELKKEIKRELAEKLRDIEVDCKNSLLELESLETGENVEVFMFEKTRMIDDLRMYRDFLQEKINQLGFKQDILRLREFQFSNENDDDRKKLYDSDQQPVSLIDDVATCIREKKLALIKQMVSCKSGKVQGKQQQKYISNKKGDALKSEIIKLEEIMDEFLYLESEEEAWEWVVERENFVQNELDLDLIKHLNSNENILLSESDKEKYQTRFQVVKRITLERVGKEKREIKVKKMELKEKLKEIQFKILLNESMMDKITMKLRGCRIETDDGVSSSMCELM
jgi:hypothetical protein